MPKERSINPAAAQRKADKAKSIKKGKAQTQTLRNEKLAKRNPERLQKQLDDLKAIESSGGKLTANEQTILESLEKEVKAVRKAREVVGERAPKFAGGDRGGRGGDGNERGGSRGGFGGEGRGGFLGKRRRDDGSESEDDEVPEEVRRVPMPRDTPPPFPKEVLDKWYQARRDKRARLTQDSNTDGNSGSNNSRAAGGTNANSTPLGANDRSAAFANRTTTTSDDKKTPVVREEAKTVYESAPIVRDLRKEAVAFVPAVVRKKLDLAKGVAVGGLLEPEEADRLEKAGYMGSGKREVPGERSGEKDGNKATRKVMMEEVEDEDG